MSTRDAPAQGEPTGIDDTFPSHTPGVAIMSRAHSWRGHEPDGGCWYFSSLPAPANGIGGRFDLRCPRGTCYWASTELAAARERLGRSSRLVAHDEVDGASVSTASFDPGRLADLLAESAALFAVTQELASSGPYALSQQ